MKYLLDTDIIIDFSYKKEPSVSIIQSIDSSPIKISVITWSEIIYGIKKSPLPQKRRKEFDFFIDRLGVEIIDVDEKIADIYTDLKIALEKKKKPLYDFDLLVAATAMTNNLILVTRNLKHFKRIPSLLIY